MNYWLMKSEPSTFSVDDLAACPRQTTFWDGVRNYQARNMLRDEFRRGDLAYLYHSSCDEPGIVAIMEIVGSGQPDPTQFQRGHAHYDPASNVEDPRWFGVEVRLRQRMARTITLESLRNEAALGGLKLLQRGNRLSVLPVSAAHWKHILRMDKAAR
jgi:predicted RNA-binding protein with PUA-like domain